MLKTKRLLIVTVILSVVFFGLWVHQVQENRTIKREFESILGGELFVFEFQMKILDASTSDPIRDATVKSTTFATVESGVYKESSEATTYAAKR